MQRVMPLSKKYVSTEKNATTNTGKDDDAKDVNNRLGELKGYHFSELSTYTRVGIWERQTETVSSKSLTCHLDSLVNHVHILIHAQLLLRNNQGNNKHTCTAVIAVFWIL